MNHPPGWIKLSGLADGGQCEAAAEDALKNDLKSTPKCEEVVRLVLKEHRLELEEGIRQLKPGAQLRHQGVGRFRENPTLRSSSEVFLYVALTKLDKSNGMFSFLVPPEDKSIPQNQWKEEEVDMKPGEGLMWRGDCVRKSSGGYGGIMLISQYE